MNGWEARLRREREQNWFRRECRGIAPTPTPADHYGNIPSSARIDGGRPRHYYIVPGGLPGHGKR